MPRRPIWIDWDDLAALEARRDVIVAARNAAHRDMLAADNAMAHCSYGPAYDRAEEDFEAANAAFDATDHELALLDNRIGELEEREWMDASRAERREYWRAVTL